jgi:hypothetical protein
MMGMTSESTVPDPRGTDRERALFLDLLWDDAIGKQVERRVEAEIERRRSELMAAVDDEKVRALKFTLAEVDSRKQAFMSEGFYKGLIYGISGSLFVALLVAIATHYH